MILVLVGFTLISQSCIKDGTKGFPKTTTDANTSIIVIYNYNSIILHFCFLIYVTQKLFLQDVGNIPVFNVRLKSFSSEGLIYKS